MIRDGMCIFSTVYLKVYYFTYIYTLIGPFNSRDFHLFVLFSFCFFLFMVI